MEKEKGKTERDREREREREKEREREREEMRKIVRREKEIEETTDIYCENGKRELDN